MYVITLQRLQRLQPSMRQVLHQHRLCGLPQARRPPSSRHIRSRTPSSPLRLPGRQAQAPQTIAQAVITLVAASSRGYVIGGLEMLYYMDTHRATSTLWIGIQATDLIWYRQQSSGLQRRPRESPSIPSQLGQWLTVRQPTKGCQSDHGSVF